MKGLVRTIVFFSTVTLFIFTGLQSVLAAPVYITDVPGYGYNSGSYPFVGCGPTTGVMILDTYDNRLSGTDGSPGDLVSDPLTVAWDLHDNYMGTDGFGFGAAEDFHFGLEDYAFDHGYLLDAVVHVESTSYVASDWSAYTLGDNLLTDANFWNTGTWDILDYGFLTFIAAEVDAGRPFSVTVDSNGDGGTDHWMVGLGYDFDTLQWAGYNTWDSTLHWYDVESAFIAGNTMGIGFVRTFEFDGAIGGDDEVPPVPEPSTILLLASGLAGLAWYGRKRKKA